MGKSAEFGEILRYLREYDGEQVTLMEVCGTHTAEIVKNGIPSLLSPKIRLISGPGCPVCVTVTDYIDRLVELSMDPKNIIFAFGDLLRVRGSRYSLSDAKAMGAQVRMVYSPAEIIDAAKKDPAHTCIFAAVGFETTTPVYEVVLREAIQEHLSNVKLLTSLKTMPGIIRWLCEENKHAAPDRRVTGFIAPGHVCAVTGYADYEQIARDYNIPFIVSGFTAKMLILTIYGLVKAQGQPIVRNFYPQVVKREGNREAIRAVESMFEPCDAAWRGFGRVKGTGMCLKEEYRRFDAGSLGLDSDHVTNGCRCAEVLMGRIDSTDCPLFGKQCTPSNPQGACMVSQEGSCFNKIQEGISG